MKKTIYCAMMGIIFYAQNMFGMTRFDYQKVQRNVKSKGDATVIHESKKLQEKTPASNDSGASSGVNQEPHRKKDIVLSRKFFDMNEPVGVAGGGASSGVHVQKGFIPLNQLTPDEKELLEEQRKGNLRLRRDQLAKKKTVATNLIIVSDYSEINSSKSTGAIRMTIKSAFDSKQVILCTKSSFLATQKTDQSLVLAGYICKEVHNDYLLFIHQVMQYSDQPVDIRNLLLGLNFVELPDYSYEVVDPAEFEKVKMKSSGVTPDSSGRILLEALKQLQITDVSPELLPYINIYLTGHGGPGVIADISAKSQGADQPSDFLKVMQFFDKRFKTKSVALVTCYIGGKQNIDTYGMYDQQGRPVFNQYDNPLLENVSYPIINWGSLYKVVSTQSRFDFVQYFKWLNAEVPAYEKILNSVRVGSVDNWISIKFPHTSWFSPVELQNKSQTLSQVAMSTRELAVDIKPTKEVIILQANYIPQEVVIHSKQRLSILTEHVVNHGNHHISILPVNYSNQSYYFKKLRITGQDNNAIFEVLNSLIFSNIRVAEEINFAFEELQVNNVVYKNVHCFVSKLDNSQIPLTGFVYEDSQGRVFRYSWPSLVTISVLNDPFVKEEGLSKEVWAEEFNDLSTVIHNKILKSLQPNLINKLKQHINLLKNKVSASEAEDMFTKYQDKKLLTLNEVADQLSKKLLKRKDLKSVVFLLQVGMKNPDRSVQQKVKNIFEGLLREHLITSDNFKTLLPLLKTSFSSSLVFVRSQIYSMIQSLIDKGIINTDNWSLLMPLLQLESKNNDPDIRIKVAYFLSQLIKEDLVLSLNSIQSLLETGLEDSNFNVSREYVLMVIDLNTKKLITRTDLEHFKNLVSDKTLKNSLNACKAYAPEIIQDKVPVDQIDKLLVSLDHDMTFEIAFAQNKMLLLYKLVRKISQSKLLSLQNQLLPIVTEAMRSNDKIVQLIATVIFKSKLSPSIYELLPIVSDAMNSNDRSLQLIAADIFKELIEDIDYRTISIDDLRKLFSYPYFVENIRYQDIQSINPEILSRVLYYPLLDPLPLNFVTKLNIAQISQILNDHTGIRFKNPRTSYQQNFTDKSKQYMEQEKYAFEHRSIDVTGMSEDYVQSEGLDDEMTDVYK